VIGDGEEDEGGGDSLGQQGEKEDISSVFFLIIMSV
jgi:hypothetical protein